MTRTLRIRGLPGVFVPSPEALGTNPPRFAGKRFNPTAPPTAPLEERYEDADVELTDHPFLRDAVLHGHLRPLDELTARLCRVPLPAQTEESS